MIIEPLYPLQSRYRLNIICRDTKPHCRLQHKPTVCLQHNHRVRFGYLLDEVDYRVDVEAGLEVLHQHHVGVGRQRRLDRKPPPISRAPGLKKPSM